MARERDEIDKIYKSRRWQKVRKIVLIRDNYLCQPCLKRGVIKEANTVHHIEALRDDLSKAFDLENLESICPACHNKEHPERNSKGRKQAKRRKDIYKFYNNDVIWVGNKKQWMLVQRYSPPYEQSFKVGSRRPVGIPPHTINSLIDFFEDHRKHIGSSYLTILRKMKGGEKYAKSSKTYRASIIAWK